MKRRDFLQLTALSPWAWSLAACSKKRDWPQGLVEIKWDRDTCARCSMVISDRRFAAELIGGQNQALKFDDIGCALLHQREKASQHLWLNAADTRLWVADVHSTTEHMQWHTANQVHYIIKTSPMGYNFAAVANAQAGSLEFDSMRAQVLAKPK